MVDEVTAGSVPATNAVDGALEARDPTATTETERLTKEERARKAEADHAAALSRAEATEREAAQAAQDRDATAECARLAHERAAAEISIADDIDDSASQVSDGAAHDTLPA